MGKSTYIGLVPKDHPMFSGGAESFSRLAYKRSSTTTPSATDGAIPPSQDSAPQEVNPGVVPSQPYDMVKDLNGPEPDIEMLTTIFRRAIKLHSERGQQQGEGNSPSQEKSE